MNKQFSKPTDIVDTEDAMRRAEHSIELEGGTISQTTRDLMSKVVKGDMTGEEFRAAILADAGVTKVR